VCADATYRAVLHAAITSRSRLVLRETVVLGRSGERGGAYRGELAVTVDGEPLLRHDSVLDGADPVLSGPAGTGGHRVLGTLLIAGRDVPDLGERAGTCGAARWAAAPLGGPGLLLLALGDTVTAVETALRAAGQPS
jgi:urease accessory protein